MTIAAPGQENDAGQVRQEEGAREHRLAHHGGEEWKASRPHEQVPVELGEAGKQQQSAEGACEAAKAGLLEQATYGVRFDQRWAVVGCRGCFVSGHVPGGRCGVSVTRELLHRSSLFMVHHTLFLRWVYALALIAKERLEPLIGQLLPDLLCFRARAERSHFDAE